MSTDKEKHEVLDDIFVSVFTGSLAPHPSPIWYTAKWGPRGYKVSLPARDDYVQDHLRNINNTHRSMRPDEIHLRALKESADVVAKLPSIWKVHPIPKKTVLFEKFWQPGGVPWPWLIFKKGRKESPQHYQTCQPHLCAQGDHGTDPPRSRSYAVAHGGQESGSRQPAWLHQEQCSGFLQWCSYISGKEKINRCQSSGIM